jgi:2-polyprenyl-3-methyl-5-hydroxy-6-metoxy-1,4-benzoquinol methylase
MPAAATISAKVRALLRGRVAAAQRRGLAFYEAARWGGDRRRRLLERLLLGHYRSRFRRDWQLASAEWLPHYFDHRITAVEIACGGDITAVTWLRAFHTLEVLHDDAVVLDIGCGDGFFDRRFFVDQRAAIDAVDIEHSAIDHAVRVHPHERISYRRLDATVERFPREQYDVIVFDGAIGHFDPATTASVLDKVAGALAPDGVFTGSESLGREGTDHLRFFETLDDLSELLLEHFSVVAVRESAYRTSTGLERREAYWRCAHTRVPIDTAGWVVRG